ncbi:MAG: hypothetical protein IJ518_07965 [Clostridia bacterium]|nr:hypothetical protein [Clostridia bacterium]
MKVEQIINGSLRVWLSEEELEQWGLLRPGEEDRQAALRLVRRLLRHAPRPAEKVVAELIPVDGGGVLLVSALKPPLLRSPLVYRIADEDALLEILSRWRGTSTGEVPAFCLYEQADEYILVVYPTASLTQQRRWLLTEYGDLLGSGEGLAAYWAEHGHALVCRHQPDTAPVSEPIT